jgi:hydrogenase nickel incorporation protein HypA/HybF
MHELAITEEIVKIVAEAVSGAGADVKLSAVVLKIGKYAAVVPKYVQHYFDILTENTNLNGAEVRVIEIPAVARCRGCGAEYEIDNPPATECPGCGKVDFDVISGNDLVVDSIEVAD